MSLKSELLELVDAGDAKLAGGAEISVSEQNRLSGLLHAFGAAVESSDDPAVHAEPVKPEPSKKAAK